ncbi:hypothetical protein CC2G_004927 [Coprinopsis cinerea AmutBmut pab1-1]|nr:hypothetical protein CC2G_004927 [Coprinopsis cinerea AmutBmut pab1-1]
MGSLSYLRRRETSHPGVQTRHLPFSAQRNKEGSNSTDSSAGRDFLSPGALLQRIDSLWHVLSRFDVKFVPVVDR